MAKGIEILNSGPQCSIQDLGRFGYRKYGVPVSGAMDQYSGKLANALLNNEETDSVLELIQGGAKVRFHSPGLFVLTGADFSPQLNDKSISMNHIFRANPGDILNFGKVIYGNCCYLGVKRGFQSERKMGSYSQYQNVTAEPRLVKGDWVNHFTTKEFPIRGAVVKTNADHFISHLIEVRKGPEFKLLIEKELNTELTLSPMSNRMAFQFEERIKVTKGMGKMLTSSAQPGTVQLTPSGQLVVLMRDCQTTGGYPRVLQLTENAINRLAQKKPGDQIQFTLI